MDCNSFLRFTQFVLSNCSVRIALSTLSRGGGWACTNWLWRWHWFFSTSLGSFDRSAVLILGWRAKARRAEVFRICSRLFDLFLRLSDFVARERDRDGILIVFDMHVVLSNYIYKRYFSENGKAEFQMVIRYPNLGFCILFFFPTILFVVFLCQHPICVILVFANQPPPLPIDRKMPK